jgi:hypothetical protein
MADVTSFGAEKTTGEAARTGICNPAIVVVFNNLSQVLSGFRRQKQQAPSEQVHQSGGLPDPARALLMKLEVNYAVFAV